MKWRAASARWSLPRHFYAASLAIWKKNILRSRRLSAAGRAKDMANAAIGMTDPAGMKVFAGAVTERGVKVPAAETDGTAGLDMTAERNVPVHKGTGVMTVTGKEKRTMRNGRLPAVMEGTRDAGSRSRDGGRKP